MTEAKLELAEKLGQRQAQLIDLLATTPKPEITLVYFRSDSCGHCLTPDTIIPGDFKPISHYSDGESVVGFGKMTKVIRTYKRFYDGEIIQVKATGIIPFTITPEHPVLVVTGIPKKGSGHIVYTHPYWKQACQLVPKHSGEKGDYLVIPKLRATFEPKCVSLSEFTTEKGLQTLKAKRKPTVFPLNPKTAWLLGFYVADGCPSKGKVRFCLGKHEVKLIRKLCFIIQNMGYKPYIQYQKTEVIVQIPSRVLSRALPSWCGSGARNKKIPNFILYHKSSKLARYFLRGFIDGDGYVVGKYARMSTTSMKLALQLQLLSTRLGCFLTTIQVHQPKPKGTIEGRTINQHTVYEMYLNMNTYDSKKLRCKKRKNYYISPVLSVKKLDYHGHVYNLETEDSVYLANNILVHNCKAIEPSFYSYIREHPEINLIKIDADQSAEATHMLEALLKGQPPQVPTVLVNDQFIVKGDVDFLPRLIIAINLAKQIGETREEKTKWHFKK